MLVAGQRGGRIPDDFGAVLQHMEVRIMQLVNTELGLNTDRLVIMVPSGVVP